MKYQEKIVLVGGGGGVYSLASHLRDYPVSITTVHTAFDSGGHSGFLRDSRGVLPVGDLRQAMLALAPADIGEELRLLLTHRFVKGQRSDGLDQATLGNVIAAAFEAHYKNRAVAVAALCRLFRIRGKVLPVSIDTAHLSVELSDRSILEGEGVIDLRPVSDKRTIKRAFLKPKAKLLSDVADALRSADKIVLCPGDFWTSLIPNFLVEGFLEAVKESSAKVIFVSNIMTKKSETDGYDINDFVQKIKTYLPIGRPLDFVLVNNTKIPKDVLKKYKAEGGEPVSIAKISKKDALKVVRGDFVDISGSLVRHNAVAAKRILDL